MLRTAKAMAGALVLSAGFVLPAAAAAGTGGTAPGGAPPTPAPQAPAAPAGPHTIQLSAAGSGLVDRALPLRGAVARRYAGRTVLIQASSGAGWSTVANAPADRRGAFTARWRSHRSGRFTLRAVIDGGARRAARAPSSAPARVTVYPSAIATWYGPRSTGVWTTACGTQLKSTTLGVAHRTLPCGTRVELFYAGRTLVVPVIDRGPYSSGADWDLSVAASDALGFSPAGVARIGALPLR